MANLKLRDTVRDYRRDTYLGKASHPMNVSFQKIDCAIGSSMWGASPLISRAHEEFDPLLNTAYPDMRYAALRVRLLKRFSVIDLDESQLFLGHGSFNLAERLIHKLLESKKMIGVGPQFNEIPSEFVAAGGEYTTVLIKAPSYEFPIEELVESIDASTSVVYIDNPNNPLGRSISLKTIAAIATQAERYGSVVIIDEAYGDFMHDSESAVHLVPRFSNIAVIRSFSKMLGLAAARVGYMFLSSALASVYDQLSVPFEPTLYSARLAEATLDDLTFIPTVREKVRASKRHLVSKLLENGLTVLPTHDSTSIMTAQTPGRDITAAFAGIGISVEPGSEYRHTHPGWDSSYCRIRIPAEEFQLEFTHRLKYLREKVPQC